MLEDLRTLRATLNVLIDGIERVEPVLRAWKGDSLQEALESPPGGDSLDPHPSASQAAVAHEAPAGEEQHAVSRGEPETRDCLECGEAFTVLARGQNRKYCGVNCRQRANRRDKAERDAKAAEPAPLGGAQTTTTQVVEHRQVEPESTPEPARAVNRTGYRVAEPGEPVRDPVVTKALGDLAHIPPATARFGPRGNPPAVPTDGRG